MDTSISRPVSSLVLCSLSNLMHICGNAESAGSAEPQPPPSKHTQLDPKTPDIFQAPPASQGQGPKRRHEVFLYALSMTGRSEHPEETRMLQQVSSAFLI